MAMNLIQYFDSPVLEHPRLIIGLSGWMDGGEVSTGTVDYLVERLEADRLAEIEPSPFYIYNFPGSMEIAALFRPHVKIEGGMVTQFQDIQSVFHYDSFRNLIFFRGREPNLRWREYADCLLSVITRFQVSTVAFVGSVAGLTPHTRDPRIFCGVSDESLIPLVEQHDMVLSDYEGPGSFVTYLMTRAHQARRPLVSLVAEVPAYVQGRNFKCVEVVIRKLSAILGFSVDLADLMALSNDFEKRLNKTLREMPELAEQIGKIEEAYDKEVAGPKDDELKAWLERQGIRLD